jgi:hypothetical protein
LALSLLLLWLLLVMVVVVALLLLLLLLADTVYEAAGQVGIATEKRAKDARIRSQVMGGQGRMRRVDALVLVLCYRVQM